MPQNFGLTYRSGLPGIGSDDTQKQQRHDQYGGVHTRGELLAWAEEGTYFRAIGGANPMTTTTSHTASYFLATEALLAMVNGSSTVRVIPHYIKIICTHPGTFTINSQAAFAIDSVNRYHVGGVDLSTRIVNSNTALGATSGLSVLRFGAVTATSAGAGTRYISNDYLKVQAAPCWVIGDSVTFTFTPTGDVGSPSPTSGTAPIAIVKEVGPVVLGGQNSSLLLHLLNINALVGPMWACEMAWWER